MTISSTPAMKGRVLIAGATGLIGQFVAEASLDSGRPTYVLVRSCPTCPTKAKVLQSLQDKGAIVLHGSISEKKKMEEILRENEIDIVISAVGGEKILDQIALVEAVKAVGTIKRFLPSEFGHDVDRADPVEPGLLMYKEKRLIRRLTEESAYFVAGTDIGKFTMKTVDDVRTLNKSVHFRPSCNFYNMNELASLWEMKIGRTLPRVTVTENDLLAAAAENLIPQSIVASFTHDIFIRGCQTNFAIDGADHIEVSSLYPGEVFRTLEECFTDFALRLNGMVIGNTTEAANPSPVVEAIAITATCA
ncbi:hypothetical protein Tsubulata_047223 [Turnera subulata]|uniref:NmrA-like domain-containing protein n=1 Tax=Turnera subulata TaxID=218843 RepID=A0A9Q0GEV3_9ROSI|nr:hypothetical protein Tsubulata_047223 [Turnera subulata]